MSDDGPMSQDEIDALFSAAAEEAAELSASQQGAVPVSDDSSSAMMSQDEIDAMFAGQQSGLVIAEMSQSSGMPFSLQSASHSSTTKFPLQSEPVPHPG